VPIAEPWTDRANATDLCSPARLARPNRQQRSGHKPAVGIAISDFPASLLHKMLGSALAHHLAKKAESSEKHIFISLKSTSLTDLLKNIERQL
jgi:hypothetical protein